MQHNIFRGRCFVFCEWMGARLSFTDVFVFYIDSEAAWETQQKCQTSKKQETEYLSENKALFEDMLSKSARPKPAHYLPNSLETSGSGVIIELHVLKFHTGILN